MKLIIGLSGSSGLKYGIRFLEMSKMLKIETHLILTKWSEEVIKIETEYSPDYVRSLAYKYYNCSDLKSVISSGSFKHDGMVIIPSSMKTVSAIANGYSENLLHRVADVAIKEKRKLIIVPRETPLSVIHLENLLKLAKVGVLIAPPMPAFYNKPKTIDDIINNLVGRLFDYLGVENNLYKKWEDVEDN